MLRTAEPVCITCNESRAMKSETHTETLWSKDFILMCINNLSHSLAVNSVMPVLPLYLLDDLGMEKASIGFILCMYPLGALMTRPIAGYLSDSLPLLPLFIIMGSIYSVFFPFYTIVTFFILLALMRLIQGISFGIANTAQNTIAVSVIPQSRMGNGLGIFSSMTALGMIVGPMIGIAVLKAFGYDAAFRMSFLFAFIGMLLCLPVKVKKIKKEKRARISLSRMIYIPGLPAALCMLCVIFLYGMFLNYVAVFVREANPDFDTGVFYGLMGIGLIVSRLFGGRLIDHGYLRPLLIAAKCIIAAGTVMMVSAGSALVFLASGFLLGMSFGLITPAYQTIIVKMADSSQWGAANSTFCLAMDSGMMLAMLVGGFIAGALGYSGMFLSALAPIALSLVLFVLKVNPFYEKALKAKEADRKTAA